MFNLDLPWKEFSVSVPTVRDAVNLLITSTPILGISCSSILQIHCEVEPTQSEINAVNAYWEALAVDSVEATSYKSQVQILEEQKLAKDALLASAKAKLALLGLSEAEITAILS